MPSHTSQAMITTSCRYTDKGASGATGLAQGNSVSNYTRLKLRETSQCSTLSARPCMEAQKRSPVFGSCFLPTAARRRGAPLREVAP